MNELDGFDRKILKVLGEDGRVSWRDLASRIGLFHTIGMPEETYERYLSIVHKPYGMLVCSGPTGSGKTTTLYATLGEISRSELNVMTIEDPVEYVFPAVNQMQINLQADVTFAAGLKSILVAGFGVALMPRYLIDGERVVTVRVGSYFAGGIETEEQRASLLELGCEEGQGYLFSRPLDEAAFRVFASSCGQR